ncbi:hypothetical protein GGU11DRAFT_825008 [Lentinula aff. detonsa]|nr:hypothetical protein GGU11DRAFT_825008 [Lentinula aff. detonsa]
MGTNEKKGKGTRKQSHLYEEEKKRIAEEERLRQEKLKLEAEKQRQEQEERRKEEEQMRLLKEEEEAAAAARIKVEQEAEAQVEEQEEGEVLEPLIQQSDEKAAETKSDEQKPLRIDTAAPSEPLPKRRPGRLDLSTVDKPNIPAPLPSALATALGRVPYPEGVQSPKIELNVNAKDGKFR